MTGLWERIPAPVRGLVSVILVLVVLASTQAVGDSLPPGLAAAWSFFVLAVAIGTVILIVRRGKRMVGGQQQHALLKASMKTGVVPAEADRDQWRTALRRMTDDRSSRWFYIFLGAFILVVNVGGYISLRDEMGVGWTLAFAALLLIVLGGYVLLPAWFTRRRVRQARVLLAALDEPPA